MSQQEIDLTALSQDSSLILCHSHTSTQEKNHCRDEGSPLKSAPTLFAKTFSVGRNEILEEIGGNHFFMN